ncbi:hypothetical protein WH47_10888 [Habropoda laboriosa]|uniref:Uncharacterized protein n=1 Tax=Habropoda laboriosa TaxID=597456 RepID=A0A0L7RDN0_9HYME|nr:hypothetical protein WH47_10888 [Habropoda laboriosa]
MKYRVWLVGYGILWGGRGRDEGNRRRHGAFVAVRIECACAPHPQKRQAAALLFVTSGESRTPHQRRAQPASARNEARFTPAVKTNVNAIIQTQLEISEWIWRSNVAKYEWIRIDSRIDSIVDRHGNTDEREKSIEEERNTWSLEKAKTKKSGEDSERIRGGRREEEEAEEGGEEEEGEEEEIEQGGKRRENRERVEWWPCGLDSTCLGCARTIYTGMAAEAS